MTDNKSEFSAPLPISNRKPAVEHIHFDKKWANKRGEVYINYNFSFYLKNLKYLIIPL